MSLRTHGRAKARLTELSNCVEEMAPEEVHGLDNLLEMIIALKGTSYQGRVLEGLSQKLKVCFGNWHTLQRLNHLQTLTERCKKAEQVRLDLLFCRCRF